MGNSKISKTILDQRGATIGNESFSGIEYTEVRFWGGIYHDCVWTNCKFKRSVFGNAIEFHRCRFIGCKFLSAYTSISARSINCLFEDCLFDGTSMEGSSFENCRLSGVMRDMVLFGEEEDPPFRTTFTNVDLVDMVFELTSFREKMDLHSTRLNPNPGSLTIED